MIIRSRSGLGDNRRYAQSDPGGTRFDEIHATPTILEDLRLHRGHAVVGVNIQRRPRGRPGAELTSLEIDALPAVIRQDTPGADAHQCVQGRRGDGDGCRRRSGRHLQRVNRAGRDAGDSCGDIGVVGSDTGSNRGTRVSREESIAHRADADRAVGLSEVVGRPIGAVHDRPAADDAVGEIAGGQPTDENLGVISAVVDIASRSAGGRRDRLSEVIGASREVDGGSVALRDAGEREGDASGAGGGSVGLRGGDGVGAALERDGADGRGIVPLEGRDLERAATHQHGGGGRDAVGNNGQLGVIQVQRRVIHRDRRGPRERAAILKRQVRHHGRRAGIAARSGQS